MIAKTVLGMGFKGALSYNLKEASKVLYSNAASTGLAGWLEEVKTIRHLRPNLKNAVQHTSISLAHGEHLSDENWQKVAEIYLKKMGFDVDANQFWLFKHTDKEHEHIHLVINRINGVTAEVVDKSHNFRKQTKIMRELETMFNLSAPPEKPPADRFVVITKNEIELHKRTGKITPRIVIAQIIDDCLAGKPDLKTFIDTLALAGVDVRLKENEETGVVKGISFNYGGQKYTGSGIGSAYSFSGLIKKGLNYGHSRVEESSKERITSEPDTRNNPTIKPVASNHPAQPTDGYTDTYSTDRTGITNTGNNTSTSTASNDTDSSTSNGSNPEQSFVANERTSRSQPEVAEKQRDTSKKQRDTSIKGQKPKFIDHINTVSIDSGGVSSAINQATTHTDSRQPKPPADPEPEPSKCLQTTPEQLKNKLNTITGAELLEKLKAIVSQFSGAVESIRLRIKQHSLTPP